MPFKWPNHVYTFLQIKFGSSRISLCECDGRIFMPLPMWNTKETDWIICDRPMKLFERLISMWLLSLVDAFHLDSMVLVLILSKTHQNVLLSILLLPPPPKKNPRPIGRVTTFSYLSIQSVNLAYKSSMYVISYRIAAISHSQFRQCLWNQREKKVAHRIPSRGRARKKSLCRERYLSILIASFFSHPLNEAQKKEHQLLSVFHNDRF